MTDFPTAEQVREKAKADAGSTPDRHLPSFQLGYLTGAYDRLFAAYQRLQREVVQHERENERMRTLLAEAGVEVYAE